MSKDTVLLIVMFGPMPFIILCNSLDRKRRPKFWNKYFQAELFSCLIPLVSIVAAGYRILCLFVSYVEDDLE